MDAIIKKIYDMMYSPLTTPYNLLENAKLDNYNYVKYYKSPEGLTAEMECFVEGAKKIFYYCFDEKDYLQAIYTKDNNEKTLLFTREDAITEAKREYYSNKISCKEAI